MQISINDHIFLFVPHLQHIHKLDINRPFHIRIMSRLRFGCSDWACDHIINIMIHCFNLNQLYLCNDSNLQQLMKKNKVTINCQICKVALNYISKLAQQCPRCGRIVCQKCLWGHIKVYQQDNIGKTLRCCRWCFQDQQLLEQLVMQNKLIFGQSSQIADEWVSALNKQKMSLDQMIQEYNQKSFQTNQNVARWLRQGKSWTIKDSNFSLRQLLGRLWQGISTPIIEDRQSGCIVAVLAKIPQLPYSPCLSCIVSFLLCFCSPVHCYFVLTRFIIKTYPQWPKLLSDQMAVSRQLVVIRQLYAQVESTPLPQQSLLSLFVQPLMAWLTIDWVNVNLTFYVINQMFKNKSYIELYKAIAALLGRGKILFFSNDPTVFISFANKQVSLQQLKTDMGVFDRNGGIVDNTQNDASYKKLKQKYKQLASNHKHAQEQIRNLKQQLKRVRQKNQSNEHLTKQTETKLRQMQQQILSNAVHYANAQQHKRLQQQNAMERQRATAATLQTMALRKKCQQMEMQRFQRQTQQRIFQQVRDDYQNQLIQLRTKNQLYQIQKQANNVTFDTSIIETIIQQKNQLIAQLQNTNQQLTASNQFLANKNSPVNVSQQKLAESNSMDTFQKYMEMSRQVNQGLQAELADLRKQCEQIKKENAQLLSQKKKLLVQLQGRQKFKEWLQEVPDYSFYQQSLKVLSDLLNSQLNTPKRVKLQQIKDSFCRCVQQNKAHYLDAKLKAQKIREIHLRIVQNQPLQMSIAAAKHTEQDASSRSKSSSGQSKLIPAQSQNNQCSIY